jgi:cytochrome c-type biogenesis protein
VKKWQRWLAVMVIGMLAVATFYLNPSHQGFSPAKTSLYLSETSSQKDITRLLELGSTTCIPCQMMEKVLESLRHGYQGRLQVDFIDVTVNPDAGRHYQIKLIPTQIFFSPEGKELFRHEGFFPELEIISQWQRLGYHLEQQKTIGSAAGQQGRLASLFSSLGQAVAGTPIIALLAAFIWGILSILLSPCHLASIPLIVGFIDKQGRMSVKRASLIATLFAVGILVTIGIIGALTGAAGRMMGDLGPYANYGVAAIFLLVALHLADIISLDWTAPGTIAMKRKGPLAALLLGLVFGIALGPCTFAYMAPMLAITFKTAATHTIYAVALLLAYGLGHCSVIVLAGTCTEILQNYLNWSEKSRGTLILKKACAFLVLIGGLYLIYKT